jgi:transaldolase / glucose-6-phosphate isomerase
MKDTIEDWRERGVVRRLWRRDKSIWTSADEDKWLGWLDSVDLSLKQRLPGARHGRTEPWAGSVGADIRKQSGWLTLRILDSTDPAQIRATEAAIDMTLFMVSSKSGTTTESLGAPDLYGSDRTTSEADAERPWMPVPMPS